MRREPLFDSMIAALAAGCPPGSPGALENLDVEEALVSMAQEIRDARLTMHSLRKKKG